MNDAVKPPDDDPFGSLLDDFGDDEFVFVTESEPAASTVVAATPEPAVALLPGGEPDPERPLESDTDSEATPVAREPALDLTVGASEPVGRPDDARPGPEAGTAEAPAPDPAEAMAPEHGPAASAAIDVEQPANDAWSAEEMVEGADRTTGLDALSVEAAAALASGPDGEPFAAFHESADWTPMQADPLPETMALRASEELAETPTTLPTNETTDDAVGSATSPAVEGSRASELPVDPTSVAPAPTFAGLPNDWAMPEWLAEVPTDVAKASPEAPSSLDNRSATSPRPAATSLVEPVSDDGLSEAFSNDLYGPSTKSAATATTPALPLTPLKAAAPSLAERWAAELDPFAGLETTTFPDPVVLPATPVKEEHAPFGTTQSALSFAELEALAAKIDTTAPPERRRPTSGTRSPAKPLLGGRLRGWTSRVERLWNGPLGWQLAPTNDGLILRKVMARLAVGLIGPVLILALVLVGLGAPGAGYASTPFLPARSVALWSRGTQEYPAADHIEMSADGLPISARLVAQLRELYVGYWQAYNAAVASGDSSGLSAILAPELLGSLRAETATLRSSGAQRKVAGGASDPTQLLIKAPAPITNPQSVDLVAGPTLVSLLGAAGSSLREQAYATITFHFVLTDAGWRIGRIDWVPS